MGVRGGILAGASLCVTHCRSWTGCWLPVQCAPWCQESCWLAVSQSAAAPADEPGLGKTVQVRVHSTVCVLCAAAVRCTLSTGEDTLPARAHRSEAEKGPDQQYFFLRLQMLALIVTSPYPEQEDAEDAAKDAARQQNTMESHVLGVHLPIRAKCAMLGPDAGRLCQSLPSALPAGALAVTQAA